MGTLHDMTRALEDSYELQALAVTAGITRVEARRFLAALADTPIRQAIRLTTTCKLEQTRQQERAKRVKR